MAAANETEYKRLEVEDPEKLERINDCFCLLFSAALQPLAIKEYGNTSDQSIRQLLLGGMPDMEDTVKLRQLIDDSLKSVDPDHPVRKMMRQFVSDQESQVAGLLASLVGRVRLIPEADASAITDALFDMWKDEGHDDNRRNPQG